MPVLYGVMTLYTFIIIPFAYFYFEEYDEGRTTKQVRSKATPTCRCCVPLPHPCSPR